MNKHFLVINGDPAPSAENYCSQLSNAFAAGVRSAGWLVHELEAATLRFSSDGVQGTIAPSFSSAIVKAAGRIAVVLPLPEDFPNVTLMPGVLIKALGAVNSGHQSIQLIVVTEMPAFLYRSWCCGHGPGSTLKDFHDVRIAFVGSSAAWSIRDILREFQSMWALGAQCATAA